MAMTGFITKDMFKSESIVFINKHNERLKISKIVKTDEKDIDYHLIPLNLSINLVEDIINIDFEVYKKGKIIGKLHNPISEIQINEQLAE